MSPPTADPLRPVDPLRLRHVHRERVLGRDLTDQDDQDDQLRWWHSRALHAAYGIVRGLAVHVVEAEGVATVAPGLAYDCHGRELVLAAGRQIPVPPGPEIRYLVLARRAAAVGGVALSWLPRDVATRGDGVPLAVTGADAPPLSPVRVRPLARPRIGRGATISGATAWQPWVEVIRGEEWQLGIQVDIDTSAAGFTAPPCYFGQVSGSLWDPRLALLFLIPFGHVARQGKDGFTFRLLMPWLYLFDSAIVRPAEPSPAASDESGAVLLDATGQRAELADAARRQDYREAFRGLARITDLAVTWIGIQHDGAVPHREEGPP